MSVGEDGFLDIRWTERIADFVANYDDVKANEDLKKRLEALSQAGVCKGAVHIATLESLLSCESGPNQSLRGVAISVKEHISRRGVALTFGTNYLGEPADEDSTIVARLRAAGARIVCSGNVSELGLSFDTRNEPLGVTENPWRPDRTPGGSSGGDAALVARGLVAAAVGGDVGGGLRIPANWCGVIALRPTPGLVPRTGVGQQPARWQPRPRDSGAYGPLTRCIDDADLILSVISGPDWLDPRATLAPSRRLAYRQVDVRSLRVGLVGCTSFKLAPAAHQALTKASSLLAAAGVEVVDCRQVDHSGFDLCRRFWGWDLGQGLRSGRPGTPDSEQVTWHYAFVHRAEDQHAGLERPARDLHSLEAELEQWRATVLSQTFALGLDALLTPCVADVAPRPDACHDFELIAGSLSFSLLPGPALVVSPLVWSDGLPIGAQLVGRPSDEATLLALGAVLEVARPAPSNTA